jgi:Ca2+/H+ antiporter, TMEM165/GDT1 family
MTPNRMAAKIAKVLLIAVVAATVAGFVVMGLWNALIPPIFGLRAIGFWQALGLLVLAKLLFGGFHRHSPDGGGHWRRAMRERWEQMTPEERERFRATMQGRCRRGPFAAPVEPQP